MKIIIISIFVKLQPMITTAKIKYVIYLYIYTTFVYFLAIFFRIYSIHGGIQNGRFIMENPIKADGLGVPAFEGT